MQPAQNIPTSPTVERDLSRSIFLYGPPGSGKTTLGRALADSLDIPFVDLDQLIESQAGISIPQIFSTEGEAGFRARERSMLLGLLEAPIEDHPSTRYARVISLGGGTLLDAQLRQAVETHGPIICLEVPFETLMERLAAKNSAGFQHRPLLASREHPAARLISLLQTRADHYASFDLQFDLGQVADRCGTPIADLTPQSHLLVAALQALTGQFRIRGMGQPYDINILPGGLEQVGDILRKIGSGGPIALVSDENVAPVYAPAVLHSLEKSGFRASLTILPAGEAQKSIATVTHLWEQFVSTGIERGSTILALGGGVISDLAGFAASAFLRGVRWVVLPTSLLAMVDASLGGKTGVDLSSGKNLVGAFHPPNLVLVDPAALRTLPDAEFRNGLAEVVKHAILADSALFSRLSDLANQPGELRAAFSNPDATLLARAIGVKAAVICEDPYERGRRAALNLGHTIGHAVEVASDYRLRHGEAVSIGLVGAARLAERLGLASTPLAAPIGDLLQRIGLPTRIPPDVDREAILRALSVDKKRADGQVRFALPIAIGNVQVGHAVDTQTTRSIVYEL